MYCRWRYLCWCKMSDGMEGVGKGENFSGFVEQFF